MTQNSAIDHPAQLFDGPVDQNAFKKWYRKIG
jgi:hypothetical protein